MSILPLTLSLALLATSCQSDGTPRTPATKTEAAAAAQTQTQLAAKPNKLVLPPGWYSVDDEKPEIHEPDPQIYPEDRCLQQLMINGHTNDMIGGYTNWPAQYRCEVYRDTVTGGLSLIRYIRSGDQWNMVAGGLFKDH